MKTVVVVGAGPCGLSALKEMLEKGHDAVLFEKSAGLGGVFASAAIYPNLHLTISNWTMAFSDFPDPERMCYPTAEHYLRYLQAYAAQFNLEDHIRYNSEVCHAKLHEKGRWSLKVKQEGQHEVLTMQCDSLIVATGANQVPKPLPSQLSGFSGRVLHSVDYNEAFKHEVAKKELRVLIVGGGESGADISAELSELSPNISVWLRRPVCVGPRYITNKSEMEQVAANKVRDFPANGFLEAATTNRMSASLNVYSYGFFRRILWHTSVLNQTLNRMDLASTTAAFVMNDQATYVTKNQRMCEAIDDGRLEIFVCPKVSVDGDAVEFDGPDDNKQRRRFDAIVLCNGFGTSFPWLEVDGLDTNPRSWFLHCFPPNLGHCLSFVGYSRPHQGGIPVTAEMLSRYIALLLAGERHLPLDYAAQAQQDRLAEREYYHISPDLNTLVDYNAFLESIARRIGCEPRMPTLSTVILNLHTVGVLFLLLGCIRPDFNIVGTQYALLLWICTAVLAVALNDGILIKWWFYPCWSVWYRQRGPGAKPALLDSALRRVPLWKATAITQGFVLMVVWSFPVYYMQRFMSMVLFALNLILDMLGIGFSKGLGGLLRPKLFVLHGTQWRISDLFLP